MAESTATTKLSEADWQLARSCGLLMATPGTNAQDAALHEFAASIRQGRALSNEQIMALYDAEIMRNGSADSVILRTVRAALAA